MRRIFQKSLLFEIILLIVTIFSIALVIKIYWVDLNFDSTKKTANIIEASDRRDEQVVTTNNEEAAAEEDKKTELQILADKYFSETEDKVKELDLQLKQNKNLEFIKSEVLFKDEIAAMNIKYPNLKCGDEEIRFTYVPDPYREGADEIVIFEDKLEIKVVNKNNEILQSKDGYNLQHLSKINYGNSEYYLTEEYTGGAHCCFEQRVITCQNGKAKIGEEVDFGNSTGYSDVFIKNKQIYYRKYDRRFDYFNLSYAESGDMAFPAFYKFDAKQQKFINASNEFPDYYLDIAKQQDEWITKMKENKSTFYNGAEELWFYPLIQRLVASYISGQDREVIKGSFITDFNYFIESPLVEQNFLFPLTKDDAERVYNDAIEIMSE